MKTIWTVLAVYAVLYAVTVVLTGDSTLMLAGLLVGLVILVPATFAAIRGHRHPAGRGPVRG